MMKIVRDGTNEKIIPCYLYDHLNNSFNTSHSVKELYY